MSFPPDNAPIFILVIKARAGLYQSTRLERQHLERQHHSV